MNLLIVESPNKTKKIAEYLGPGWRVEASFGHIRDLPKTDDIGISRSDFQLHYEVQPEKRAQVAFLRAAIAQADNVYLGTDPDREGEAIAWHLMDELRLKAPKRVTFNVISKSAVCDAIATPRSVDMALVRAQEARRALDRLVGWDVSPVLFHMMRSANAEGKASAGRVQTPAVLLCALREDEIEGFKPTTHFGARVQFEGGSWSADLVTAPFLGSSEKYLLDEALASRAASARQFQVVKCDVKPVARNPPAPFSTSTLLQAASAALGMSPEQTQRTAQKLFEQGLISYHRTDSVNLSDEAISEIREYAGARGIPLPATPRRWKEKDSAQEAHEAIRPASISTEQGGSDNDERRLYRLIWERAVASQLTAADYVKTTLLLEALNTGSERFQFLASGSVMTTPGWTAVTVKDAADEGEGDEDASSGRVPSRPVGTNIVAERGEVVSKVTTPPSRYTEAGLINALEKHGIGRPATYAAIIGTIKARKYVELRKKALVATPLGRTVIKLLRGRFSFVELNFTSAAEKHLDAIADGRAEYREVVSRFNDQLVSEISKTGIDPQAILKPSEKALAFGESIAHQLGVELPAGARTTGSELTQWIDAHKGQLPPSEKALDYAQSLARKAGVDLPEKVMTSTQALTAWIDTNKSLAEKAVLARMAGEPATESQINVITKLIGEGRIEAPAGWPSINKRAASEIMDRIFGGKKGGATKPPTKARGAAGKPRSRSK